MMEFFLAILKEMGRVLVNNLTSPSFLFFFGLLFALVALQYRRLQTVSESMLQCSKDIYIRAALVSALLGLAGGVAGSLILILLGVDMTGIAVGQLWLAAFILMLIKPRYLCFAYAAGLISTTSLLIGYPTVNIPQLMGLVGVLHLVESLLIVISGSIWPWPVYIKQEGKMRGGFNLQQFWPIPLVALVTVGVIEPRGAIHAPEWWPLLKDGAGLGNNHTYILIPLLAMLGYGEITTTKTPARAVRKTSWHLLVYSAGLILLSILASRHSLLLPLAALYSPVGHEMVVWAGMRSEKRAPLYIPPPEGLMILDVVPGSPAFTQGLHSHDVILTAEGEAVSSHQEFLDIANRAQGTLRLEMTRGRERLSRRLKVKRNTPIGIIPVPEEGAQGYMFITEDGLFPMIARLWQRIRHMPFTF